jgi:hypothetical protein
LGSEVFAVTDFGVEGIDDPLHHLEERFEEGLVDDEINFVAIGVPNVYKMVPSIDSDKAIKDGKFRRIEHLSSKF